MAFESSPDPVFDGGSARRIDQGVLQVIGALPVGEQIVPVCPRDRAQEQATSFEPKLG
ncbi:hypothetical protein [Lichenicoccus sp.]|uniref:hypothetical protein n=1 Tax=Lichenicoccus sp. TaxID=2781899 RepID=UPI003D09CE43